MGFGIFMPALELPNFGVNEIASIFAGIPFREFGRALEIHIDPNVNHLVIAKPWLSQWATLGWKVILFPSM